MPLLQAEARVGRIVGIARRPFDPAAHGWTKMIYREGDVRDPDALAAAFAGADVVVHLAFMITGRAPRATIRAINVEGTLNTFRAAAAAGVTRFVYASSVAAYGFGRDNPVGMTEDWPTRPAAHLFYAREKAEIEDAARCGGGGASGGRALRPAPAGRGRSAQHGCEGDRPGAARAARPPRGGARVAPAAARAGARAVAGAAAHPRGRRRRGAAPVRARRRPARARTTSPATAC